MLEAEVDGKAVMMMLLLLEWKLETELEMGQDEVGIGYLYVVYRWRRGGRTGRDSEH